MFLGNVVLEFDAKIFLKQKYFKYPISLFRTEAGNQAKKPSTRYITLYCSKKRIKRSNKTNINSIMMRIFIKLLVLYLKNTFNNFHL